MGLNLEKLNVARFNLGELVLTGVDQAVTLRWDAALRDAERTVGTTDERVGQLSRSYAQELGAAGALAGGVAAVPGVGTTAMVGTAVAEITWSTMRMGTLILATGAVHGFTEAEVEERRLWVLSILAYGGSAGATLSKLTGTAGAGRGPNWTAQLPGEALSRLNRRVGRTLVTKFGAQRGALLLGRVIPFGVGAVIGGTANYKLTRGVATKADDFFRTLSLPAPRAPTR